LTRIFTRSLFDSHQVEADDASRILVWLDYSKSPLGHAGTTKWEDTFMLVTGKRCFFAELVVAIFVLISASSLPATNTEEIT
jgi:hypothetical protein